MNTTSPLQLFSSLTPDTILSAAESYTGLKFDGTITPYNSYVNRVFGLTSDDGNDYIIKFYRSGRWSKEAILDEHQFLTDCAENEVPVVAPIFSKKISGTISKTDSGLFFTIFPRLRARTFDIYTDEDWLRTGRAIGRLHCSSLKHKATNRLQCTPQQTTTPYITYLLKEKLISPELVSDFTSICDNALDYIEEAYRTCFGECDSNGVYHTQNFIRIHGDCHRGNILEQFISQSPAKTTDQDKSIITLIDFDDMMTGPAIQDLWLLLPGYRKDSAKELNLLFEGYGEFGSEQILRAQTRLIEPLRFMRNIYFLAWTAIQHSDEGFAERNPDWGTKAFWEKEIEDLNTQLGVLKEEYDYFQTPSDE